MKAQPFLTLIAAVSKDGFISQGQGIPWELPRDKAHFRQATAGQWLLIGRRTYEEMLGWFRDHHPLVLTRDPGFQPSFGEAVQSVEAAMQAAAKGGAAELFVCGGAGAYTAAMPSADRLIITEVDTLLGSGVPFPVIDPEHWRPTARESCPPDPENTLGMVFLTFERQRQPRSKN